MFIDSVESRYTVGTVTLGHSISSHSTVRGAGASVQARARSAAQAAPVAPRNKSSAHLGNPSANVPAVVLPWVPCLPRQRPGGNGDQMVETSAHAPRREAVRGHRPGPSARRRKVPAAHHAADRCRSAWSMMFVGRARFSPLFLTGYRANPGDFRDRPSRSGLARRDHDLAVSPAGAGDTDASRRRWALLRKGNRGGVGASSAVPARSGRRRVSRTLASTAWSSTRLPRNADNAWCWARARSRACAAASARRFLSQGGANPCGGSRVGPTRARYRHELASSRSSRKRPR